MRERKKEFTFWMEDGTTHSFIGYFYAEADMMIPEYGDKHGGGLRKKHGKLLKITYKYI